MRGLRDHSKSESIVPQKCETGHKSDTESQYRVALYYTNVKTPYLNLRSESPPIGSCLLQSLPTSSQHHHISVLRPSIDHQHQLPIHSVFGNSRYEPGICFEGEEIVGVGVEGGFRQMGGAHNSRARALIWNQNPRARTGLTERRIRSQGLWIMLTCNDHIPFSLRIENQFYLYGTTVLCSILDECCVVEVEHVSLQPSCITSYK